MIPNFLFQELNVNFSTIIIPETMKKLLVEDETVLDMIAKLNLIISTCTLPLPELIKELQTHLRYMIMGMPVSRVSLAGDQLLAILLEDLYFVF